MNARNDEASASRLAFDGWQVAVQNLHAAARSVDALIQRQWLDLSLDDPNHPLYVPPGSIEHWHVQAHGEDEDHYVAATVFDALHYAGTELDRTAEFEITGMDAATTDHDFGLFRESRARSLVWSSLSDNALRLHGHASKPDWLRPPAYCTGDPAEDRRLLLLAATHYVDSINAEGPAGFAVWQCVKAECAPQDEE